MCICYVFPLGGVVQPAASSSFCVESARIYPALKKVHGMLMCQAELRHLTLTFVKVCSSNSRGRVHHNMCVVCGSDPGPALLHDSQDAWIEHLSSGYAGRFQTSELALIVALLGISSLKVSEW